MSNMSYCRFRNTLNDLRDCVDHFFDDEDGGATLSVAEYNARVEMVEVMADLFDTMGVGIDLDNVDEKFLAKLDF